MTNTNHRLSPFNTDYQKHFFTFSLIALLVLTGLTGKGQTYQEAKDLAFKGEREKARQVCRVILAKEYDADVAVLMARTFAWDGKYDSSRVVIADVLKRYPAYWDALDAISDVQYWDNKYGDAIRFATLLWQRCKRRHFMLKSQNSQCNGD